jgi:hypothetical protein
MAQHVTSPEQDHVPLVQVASQEQLCGFRLIQHLTLAEVKRVQFLIDTQGHPS